MKSITYFQYEEIKRAAKRLKKELGITHSESLERLAKKSGFNNYHHLKMSVVNDGPFSNIVSTADESYDRLSINMGPVWFTLGLKEAEETYVHISFPKRWGIKEDEAKLNSIVDDLLAQFPDLVNDESHPGQIFYNHYRVFSLSGKNFKTLKDVCLYVRSIFYWDPEYVFQKDVVYETFDDPDVQTYKVWLSNQAK
jgi:hypothetical protein